MREKICFLVFFTAYIPILFAGGLALNHPTPDDVRLAYALSVLAVLMMFGAVTELKPRRMLIGFVFLSGFVMTVYGRLLGNFAGISHTELTGTLLALLGMVMFLGSVYRMMGDLADENRAEAVHEEAGRN